MAKIVNFVDFAESETTPTIGNIVASNIITYANDAAFVAAELGAPVRGNIYYNTTDENIRYYNGTTWQELIDENSVQALENKSIDADNNMITNIDNNEIKPLAGIEATKLADGSVTDAELQYINTLSSNAQTQIDSKMDKDFSNALPSTVDIDLDDNDLNNTGQINLVDPSGNGTATDGGYIRDYSEATLSGIGQIAVIGTNVTSGVTTARSHGVTVRGGDVYSGGTITDTTVGATLRSGKIRSGGVGPETGSVSVASGSNDEATNTAITGRAKIFSGNNSGSGDSGEFNSGSGDVNAGNSGEVSMGSGDSTSGNSGDVYLIVGEAPSGTRGSVILVDGSEGTTGDVWTSTGTNGEGNWSTPSASGANTSLSNLTSPTSVNQHLLMSSGNTFTLGSAVADMLNVFTRKIQSLAGLILEVPSGNFFKIFEVGNAPTIGDVLTTSAVDGTCYWDTPSGNTALSYAAKTASYTLTSSDAVIGFTTGATNKTATLPAVASTPVGKRFKIVKNDSAVGSLVIQANAAELIGDTNTFELHRGRNHIEIVNTGSAWDITSLDVEDVRTVSLTANVVLSSDGVVGDITGLSLDLQWGDWVLEYDCSARLQKTTSAGQLYGQLFVTDNSNVVITRTYAMFGSSNEASGQSIYSHLGMHTNINLTADETHKMRGEFTDNGSSGGAQMTVLGAGFSFFSGGIDGSARFTARRFR